MNAEKMKVSPKLAEEWLSRRPEFQRRLDEAHIIKLVAAIEGNMWRENGATIVFNRKDELVDGQHRLEAIRRSGRTVWCLVVTGIDATADTFHTIDDGKVRTLPSFIQVPNAFHVAAVARISYLVNRDIFPNYEKVPIVVCLKEAEPFLELFSESANVIRAASKVTAYGGFLGFLWFHYRYRLLLDENRVDEFFARLGDGVNLVEGDPIAALRNKCIQQRNSNTRILRLPMWAFIIKAMNFHMRKQKISKLSWVPGKELFPSFYEFLDKTKA